MRIMIVWTSETPCYNFNDISKPRITRTRERYKRQLFSRSFHQESVIEFKTELFVFYCYFVSFYVWLQKPQETIYFVYNKIPDWVTGTFISCWTPREIWWSTVVKIEYSFHKIICFGWLYTNGGINSIQSTTGIYSFCHCCVHWRRQWRSSVDIKINLSKIYNYETACHCTNLQCFGIWKSDT